MAGIEQGMAHDSGIPLGGVGAGSVEIRPDGHFHEWQIFNLGQWAPKQPRDMAMPQTGPGTLAFYLRVAEGGGEPKVRRLGLRCDQENLYSFAWLKSVEGISFEGRFPAARLRYADRTLPVSVEADFCSPFVPHDSRSSGTPGFFATFRVRNRGKRPARVAVLGALANFLAWGAEDRRLRNTVSRAGAATCLTMRTGVSGQDSHPTAGSLCLSVSGGRASWIAGEYPGFRRGITITHWSHKNLGYGMAHESWLHDFRRKGELPSLDGGESPSALLPMTDAEIEALPDERCRELAERLLRYPFAASMAERVAACGIAATAPGEIRTFLREAGYRLGAMDGKDRKGQNWGDGALCASVRVRPGETREICFALSWHFPFHYSARGPVLGHAYENWFADAEEVNRFLLSGGARLRREAEAFAGCLRDTTLHPALADAWAGQLTTLVKCTWWTKDDRFAVWEGLGCCGFHTTDITYQGSFNILALFPDLQRRQMEMGSAFQRGDGRVHHFFTPDLSAVDEGFDRVDMNQQFVLLVCRDYLWTGDRAFLERMWPHVERAMENTARLDGDGDGLPDRDTRRNTYDAWDFSGTPAYIASLWIAALRAAARMAGDLGLAGQADRWRREGEKAAAAFERKLWNGRYYSLWVDGATRDECCMSDQVDGEWFTSLIGLGLSLPRERLLAALRAIMRHNFRAEDGLINASYPPGRSPRVSTYMNLQASAPWTGIEYAMASMMIDLGLTAEGLAVVRNVHERYMRAGRFWDHVECGDHYYRAMSSWALLLAATGFKPDAPAGTLELAPRFRQGRLRAPWVASTGWGVLEQAAGRLEVECRSGTLRFRRLKVALRGTRWQARIGGRTLSPEPTPGDGVTALDFGRALTLCAGQRLTVTRR